jgi:gamma-glutamylcyclotransferase (GGCT)/AIG2-like uncharacterized protein YtfP
MIDRLFAYGTLEFPLVVTRVLGQERLGRPAVLHDYARSLVRSACYPAIVERAGSSVRGTLYTGIDAELFRRLDRYEGEDYRKRTVDVITEDGERHRAFTYTCSPERLSDAPWEPDVFLRDHLEAFLTTRSPWIE